MFLMLKVFLTEKCLSQVKNVIIWLNEGLENFNYVRGSLKMIGVGCDF
jgi:hypothetical protein